MENYIDFYRKSFDTQKTVFEKSIKEKLLAHKKKGHNYNFASNTILEEFQKEKMKYFINDKPYQSLYLEFKDRHSVYKKETQYEVIPRSIKLKFDKLKVNKNYTFETFLNQLAGDEAMTDIVNLFRQNSQIYELMYSLNDFDEFEIKNYHRTIETTDIFQKLHSLKYKPKQSSENNNSELTTLLDTLEIIDSKLLPPDTLEEINFKIFKQYRDNFESGYNYWTEHFIDEDQTSYDDFVNTFLEKSYHSKPTIQFSCETKLASYLLWRLSKERIFKNMTLTNIAESGKFMSLDGNILTRPNMSNSKRSCNPKEIGIVETFIKHLKNL